MRRLPLLMSLLLALAVLAALPVRAQQAAEPEDWIRRGEVAGADVSLLRAVERRATQQGLPSAERAQLLSEGVELAEQGLPSGAVLQKTLEGLAKHVPAPRMAAVLDRMQQQTVRSGRIIDAWLERPEAQRLIAEAQTGGGRGRTALVENLAEALLQDVPEGTVEAVLEQLPARVRRQSVTAAEVGTALGVLADLPSALEDPGATADLLVSALNAGFSQAELRRLPAAMQAAHRQLGGSPSETASEVARSMEGGGRSEDMLGRLFRGELPNHGIGAGPGQGGPPPGVGPDDVGPGDKQGPPGDRGPGGDGGEPPGEGQGGGPGQGDPGRGGGPGSGGDPGSGGGPGSGGQGGGNG